MSASDASPAGAGAKGGARQGTAGSSHGSSRPASSKGFRFRSAGTQTGLAGSTWQSTSASTSVQGLSTSRPAWSHAAAHAGASAAPSLADSSKRHVASLAASTGTGSRGHVALPASNVGYKLLRKAGWKEGSGLGAQEQGSIEPVQALVKKDKQGIGAQGGERLRVVGRPEVPSQKRAEPGEKEEGGGQQGQGKAKKRRRKGAQRAAAAEALSREQGMQRAFYLEFHPDNV